MLNCKRIVFVEALGVLESGILPHRTVDGVGGRACITDKHLQGSAGDRRAVDRPRSTGTSAGPTAEHHTSILETANS
jgi:hypothetical protein